MFSPQKFLKFSNPYFKISCTIPPKTWSVLSQQYIPMNLATVSVLGFCCDETPWTKSNIDRKDFISTYISASQFIIQSSQDKNSKQSRQGKNVEVGTSGALEEYCLLACSLWLTQSPFYSIQGDQTRDGTNHNELWTTTSITN